MIFLTIDIKDIDENMTLKRPIFLFDQQAQNRIVAFYPGSEVTQQALEEIQAKVNKGGITQIVYEDLEEYCHDTNCSFDKIRQINKFKFEMMEKDETFKEFYGQIIESSFNIKVFFEKFTHYKDLIKNVQAHIMCFGLDQSEEVSFLIRLAESLFIRESYPVVQACIAFSLAQREKIVDSKSLTSLTLGSLFSSLGMTQVGRQAILQRDLDLDDYFDKYPMFSISLLNKTPLIMSTMTKRIILEHQEMIDGSGFPRNKKEDQIHFLSQILHVSTQLTDLYYEYSNKENADVNWNFIFDQITLQKDVASRSMVYSQRILDLIESLKT